MNLMYFYHKETRKQTTTKHGSLLLKAVLLIACAVLLAGARGQDAAAAAKVSDDADGLLADQTAATANNAENDAATVNIEDDGVVFEAKKVAKKETAKKSSTAKAANKSAKASDDKKADKSTKKDTKTVKTAKAAKATKSETKSSGKDAKTEQGTASSKEKKDTKTADKDKKSDNASKKESSKKNGNSKDTENNDKEAADEETADDTDAPHYTVHTATGAKRLADEYQDYTYAMCEKYGITEYFDLILIQMCMESGYNLQAVGASRYYGLMQISKASFSRLESALGLTDIREPHQNIEAGVYLMSCLIQKYGDAQMALVCYHRGEGAARRGIRSDSYSAKIVAMQSTLEEA